MYSTTKQYNYSKFKYYYLLINSLIIVIIAIARNRLFDVIILRDQSVGRHQFTRRTATVRRLGSQASFMTSVPLDPSRDYIASHQGAQSLVYQQLKYTVNSSSMTSFKVQS